MFGPLQRMQIIGMTPVRRRSAWWDSSGNGSRGAPRFGVVKVIS